MARSGPGARGEEAEARRLARLFRLAARAVVSLLALYRAATARKTKGKEVDR